jgi:quercetin dioxygenase-like cupin family protein
VAIASAEVVLPCADLEATQRFFVERLGFRLLAIWPADAPRAAVIEGHGVRLRLQQGADGTPGELHLTVDDPDAFAAELGAADGSARAPNGTRIVVAAVRREIVPPLPAAPVTVVARAAGAAWHAGRAGMRYRDLIPGRLGGHCVASSIRIEQGGPVPDYVHFHRVAAQLLYCVRGRFEVVYEDQGPPLEFVAGDCILQPPTIRHRVLACDAGSEVVELACPAEHETVVDHDLALPTPRRDREYGGQRFVHARARDTSAWTQLPDGSLQRDLGIGAATHGRAGAWLRRFTAARHAQGATAAQPTGALPRVRFAFVLRGTAAVTAADGKVDMLGAGDAWTSTAAREPMWSASDAELLEVTLG